MSINCGRCGKPLFKPGLQVCDSCRGVITKDKDRHAKKMENRMEQERSLYENISAPGKDDEPDDYGREHYLDTHDASSVWVDNNPSRGKGGRRRR
ncbi:MAG: hypothetical protein ABIH11_06495 [Candidatus Altiarchaeota archaeon]